MLCDPGPLVALVLRSDEHHNAARTFIQNYPNERFVTTWSCLSEAMYILGRYVGWPAQQDLFEMIERGFWKSTAIASMAWRNWNA
jgi:predicted nucleic acid-binding protein